MSGRTVRTDLAIEGRTLCCMGLKIVMQRSDRKKISETMRPAFIRLGGKPWPGSVVG